MTLKQDLEMALAALKYHQEQTRPITQTQEAIAVLESRLANLADEPVAWMKPSSFDESGVTGTIVFVQAEPPYPYKANSDWVPLYPHPAAPERKKP